MAKLYEYIDITEDILNSESIQDYDSTDVSENIPNYFDAFDDTDPYCSSPDNGMGNSEYDTLTLDDLRILM